MPLSVLWKREADALFQRMVHAAQRSDGDKRAVRGCGPPRGLVGERFVGLEHVILERLREHTPLAPSPHLSTAPVEHDNVMRLAAREGELEALVRGVRDVEGEANAIVKLEVE